MYQPNCITAATLPLADMVLNVVCLCDGHVVAKSDGWVVKVSHSFLPIKHFCCGLWDIGPFKTFLCL